jgi:F-type H+-transporting ATPase subunit b
MQEPATSAETATGGQPETPYETFLGLDSYLWLAVAFSLFAALLWRVGLFRSVVAALDARAERVRSDLAEAAALKAEAEAMKARAAAEAAEAEALARAMLANAEAEARRIVEGAATTAADAIARRTRLAEERIAAEARGAELALRARTADLSLKAAELLIAEASARGDLDALVDRDIEAVGRR